MTRKLKRDREIGAIQARYWACVVPDGPQQKFYKWICTAADEMKRPALKKIITIPNMGIYVTPRVNKEMKLEGVNNDVLDMFLPIPNGKYHGVFYCFKLTKLREGSKVHKRAAANKLIEEGYAVIYTRDWKYAALRTLHYLNGTYEQEIIPEDKPIF